jgi:leader peptidase (prepilin peptidase)/N-methyltransferase
MPLLVAVAAVLATVSAYVFLLPEYQARGSSLFEPSELYIPRLIDVVVVMWCFWVGSSVGSFLNVVAWRVPRGESINGRSHCPRCCTQLLARDNFPVFGWLALGGRCRTCHLVISPRYPIVEGVVGLSITLVSVAELYRLSIPRQFVHWHGGAFWAPTVDQVVLLVLLYHITVLTVSWAYGLIRMDSHRVPARLMWFGSAVAVLPMLAYPMLMVVPWQMEVPEDWWPDGLYVDALVRVITALVAATVIGRYLARGICPAADPKLNPLGRSTARLIDLIAILSLAIIVVGWQASPAFTVLASILAVGLGRLLPTTCDSLGRFAIAVPIALTLQLVLWRSLDALWCWPSDGSSPWVILSWTAIVLLIPLWLRDEHRVGVECRADSAPEEQDDACAQSELAAGDE